MKRRTLIRTMTLSGLGLPFLRSIARRAHADDSAPKRLIVLCRTNGNSQEMGHYKLPASDSLTIPQDSALAPLGDLAPKVNVISGLTYQHFESAVFGCHLAYPYVLTAAPPGRVRDGGWDGSGQPPYGFSAGGPSLDRFLGASLRSTIPVESIAMRQTGSKGVNRYISYEGGPVGNAPNPAATVDSPEELWARLFGDFDPAGDGAIRRARASVIHTHVHSLLDRYRSRMAGWEKEQVEAHLQTVETVRARLNGPAPGAGCQMPAEPAADLNPIETFDVVSDLIVEALRCDITRVVTFLWDGGPGRWFIPDNFRGAARIGRSSDNASNLKEEHSDIGHGGGSDRERRRRCVDQWYVERYASLLRKLDAVREGDRSLLDNSVVVLANRDGNHNPHSVANLTWLTAGSAGGQLTTGQSVLWPSGQADTTLSHGRLLASFCRAMGGNASEFAPGDDARLPFLE